MAAAGVLALFPAMPSIWLWFPLRIALGGAPETLFVMSETRLNQLSDETTRARTTAIYTAALSFGFALGPLILSLTGTTGKPPYLLGSGIALLALLCAYPLVFVGIYTIMMTVVGSRFRGGDLVSVYAVTSVAWGVGAFLGPSSAGLAMEWTRHGLAIFAALGCAGFTCFAVLAKRST